MSELVLYSSDDGQTRLHLRVDGETAWLSQLEIAELFQTSKQNVSLHANNIFADGELSRGSVVKESLTTATDGKKYRTQLYNLDLILAIGYRVREQETALFFAEVQNKLLYAVTGHTAAELVLKRANASQPILEGAGLVSREHMERIAHERYALFDQQRREAERIQADADDLKEIEQIEQDLKRQGKP